MESHPSVSEYAYLTVYDVLTAHSSPSYRPLLRNILDRRLVCSKHTTISFMVQRAALLVALLWIDFAHILAQQWVDVEVLDLPSCSRGAIKGKKRGTVRTNTALH